MTACGKHRSNFSVEHLLAAPDPDAASESESIHSHSKSEWSAVQCNAGHFPAAVSGLRTGGNSPHDVLPFTTTAPEPVKYALSPPGPSTSMASTIAQLKACMTQWPALLDAYRALALLDSAQALDLYRSLLDGGRQYQQQQPSPLAALGLGLGLGSGGPLFASAVGLQSMVAPPTPVSVSAPALSPSLGLISLAPATNTHENVQPSSHHVSNPNPNLSHSSSQATSAHQQLHLQLSPMSASSCGGGSGVGYASQTPSSSAGAAVGAGAGSGCAQKVVSCAECGKVFNAQYNLARHMVIHSGARPFVCKVRYYI